MGQVTQPVQGVQRDLFEDRASVRCLVEGPGVIQILVGALVYASELHETEARYHAARRFPHREQFILCLENRYYRPQLERLYFSADLSTSSQFRVSQ